MKKVILCLSLIFLATGCSSSNKLVKCTGKKDNTSTNYVGTIKNGKVVKIMTTTTTKYNDEEKASMEMMHLRLASTMKGLNERDGIKATTSNRNNTLRVSAIFDITKMQEKDIKSILNTDSKEVTIDTFKKYATNGGATCK